MGQHAGRLSGQCDPDGLLQRRLRFHHEADRAENYDFLESLASWLEDQEDQGNYPELPGRYSVEGIAVQYATLYDVSQNGAGLYQVQIELTIKKEVVPNG